MLLITAEGPAAVLRCRRAFQQLITLLKPSHCPLSRVLSFFLNRAFFFEAPLRTTSCLHIWALQVWSGVCPKTSLPFRLHFFKCGEQSMRIWPVGSATRRTSPSSRQPPRLGTRNRRGGYQTADQPLLRRGFWSGKAGEWPLPGQEMCPFGVLHRSKPLCLRHVQAAFS